MFDSIVFIDLTFDLQINVTYDKILFVLNRANNNRV